MIAATLIALPACNPFEPDRGADGQPCRRDGTCDPGLSCVADRCAPFICPTVAPCDAPGLPEQGPDGDGDGWGRCCDCEDTLATFYPGAPERCDDLDNDCDGLTDEEDACPPVCIDRDGDGYGADCPAGEDCNDYNAEIHPDAAEDCNRLDDDCDGLTDEEIVPRDCPLQLGVCQGTQQACDPGQGWLACDYGPDYLFEGDTRCDGLDNDCDGETDEEALQLVPEDGLQATDGLDNNCNGLVDEPGGVLVPHPILAGVWIGAYEMTVFQNAECTGPRFGESADDYPADWPADGTGDGTLYACSLPGVVPSGHLSWYRSQQACQAQGLRLCRTSEHVAACGASASAFPYGAGFVPGACNDPIGGSGQVAAAGQYADCTVDGASFDLSGNLAEWVFDSDPAEPGFQRVAGYGYLSVLCDLGQNCEPADPDDAGDLDRLEDLLACWKHDFEQVFFPPAEALAWLGGRCCYEP